MADRQLDAIAANAIAAALLARWGHVPLSLRYAIAAEAIERARPPERLAVSDEAYAGRERFRCCEPTTSTDPGPIAPQERSEPRLRALWRRLLHRTPAGDSPVVNVNPKENR